MPFLGQHGGKCTVKAKLGVLSEIVLWRGRNRDPIRASGARPEAAFPAVPRENLLPPVLARLWQSP